MEVKNLNSFRAVKLALEYELPRQTVAVERGESLGQETRLWNAKAQRTESLRSKEDAADYRYFPEPDLVPFVLEPLLVQRARQALPELPAQRRARFQQVHQLSAYDAQVLTQHHALGQLFEGAIRAGTPPKAAANWIMGDLLAYLNTRGLDPDALVSPAPSAGQPAGASAPEGVKLRPEWLAHLVELITHDTISVRMAKGLFVQMVERGEDPGRIVEDSGLQQIVDRAALERIAEEVLRANPKSVEDYRKGKVSALTYLMGQAMKQSKGRANPHQMTGLLKQRLEQAEVG